VTIVDEMGIQSASAKDKGSCRPFQNRKKPTIASIQDELNALEKDGWELVGVQNIRLEDDRLFTVAYLKRQKP
jgi:hypothetical protein